MKASIFARLFLLVALVAGVWACSTDQPAYEDPSADLITTVNFDKSQLTNSNAVSISDDIRLLTEATNICQVPGVGSGWAFSNGTYGVYSNEDGQIHYMSELAVEQWCEAWGEVKRNHPDILGNTNTREIVNAGCEGTYNDGTHWEVWWNPDIGEWWITNSSGSYPISNALHNQYCHPNEKSPSTIEESLEFQGRTLGQAGCSGNFPDGTFFQVYKSADTGEWNICSGSPWTCTVIPAATANAHCNQK